MLFPLGQPILVGHHSESRHRQDISRMEKLIEKSIAEDEKARYYKNKIDTIQTNKSISSDDPHAIEKLQQKLKELEEYKARVKAREHAAYELSNLNSEIRRVKARIKELQELEELKFEDIEFEGGNVIYNDNVNRLQFLFENIPDEETRNILKHHGFKWSRYEKAWQRLYNKNGIYAVKCVLREMKR